MKAISITLLVSLSICHSTIASALVAGPARIKGVVKSFNQKSVNIENDNYKYEIPRNLIAQKELVPNSKIEVLLSLDQLKEIITRKKQASK